MAAGLLGVAVGAQQQPAFRSGVEVLAVDVVALDKTRLPVPGLTANDFAVVAGKKPRRIVGVDFISSAKPTRAAASLSVPGATGNGRVIAPRTLMLLVDVDQIPAGGGRIPLKSIGEYLDQLLPADQVGVMTLIDRRLSPTTDRAVVREGLNQLVGSSNRLREKEMTFGEAAGIATRDRASLMAYWFRIADFGFAMPGDRSCTPPKGFETITTVPQNCVQEAEVSIDRARMHTRRVLTRLGAIADAMATIPEPKAIILVSGGFISDIGVRNDMADLAAITERTRVTVHTLLLEAEAGGGNTTDTRRLDSNTGMGGLSDVAAASRGSSQRVITSATAALTRIDREMSGYYVIWMERDPADTPGERIDLEVRTTRPGVSLMSRQGLTPPRPNRFASNAPAGDLKASVGQLLKSAAAVPDVPLDVDVFALPVSEKGSEARAVIAIEAGRPATAIAAFGFQVADASGKVVGDGYETPPPFSDKGTGRSLFVVQATLAAGKYISRFGIVDAQGQRGSVQHTFTVPAWNAGAIRVSDVILGEGRGAAFAPAARVSLSTPMTLRMVVRDQSSEFDDVRVKATITRASDDTTVETLDAVLQPTADPLRRFADADVFAGKYPAGEYVVTMVATAHGSEIGRRQRAFVR
jgi:VWFA-related protein